MRTRRSRVGLIFAAAILAAIVLASALWPRRSGPDPAAVQAQLRAIMQALVVYAQNNADAWPQPSEMRSTFVASGLVPPEVFQVRGAPRYLAPFFIISPWPGTSRWSNSFAQAAPVLIANPELWPGMDATVVLWNDGHTDMVQGAAFRTLWAAVRDRLRTIH